MAEKPADPSASQRGTSTAAPGPRQPSVLAEPQRAEPPKVEPLPPHQDSFDDEAKYKPICMKDVMRLARCLKPYKTMYIIGAASGVLAIVLDLMIPLTTQKILDEAIPSKQASFVLYWAGIWAGLAAVSLALDVVQIWLTNKCGEQVIQDLRESVFAQLQRLSMSFYDRTKLGRIITRGTSDMESLRGPVISGINTIAFNFLMMLGAGALMLWLDWRVTLAVAWLAPVMAYCNHIYRQRVGQGWQVLRATFSRLSSNLAENITGVRVVNAYNRQEENLERFNELQVENYVNNMRIARINGFYMPFLEFIKFAGQVIIIAYGGVLVMQDGSLVTNGMMDASIALTAGQVVAIFYLWERFMSPAINMGNFYNTLMQAMASCERIFALLDMVPEVQDKPDAKTLPRLRGHIVFDHVTFGYKPERPVLKDICLDIPPGSTVALVGATGSGKSSTVSLLCRFYEFQQGRITVDGHDIREATMESLHKQMGLVLQINYLFTGTILDNIRYPRPNASDEEVYEAAKALDIHDTFMSLPNGYQTDVGERGSQVSLGMRQLICFTRVLLANPSIFLLDEATSSIDTVTETKVQRALERLVKHRTTVIVAHRLSTIVKADCIVVLDQGVIVEKGTHAELLARKGHYAGLYEKFISHQTDLPIHVDGKGERAGVLKG
ncbi:MAG TPA: ABC transporter ATP-binding protein [Planctomycetota bacterium]|nr:ABC transporter ATP-binding protein [Planctomycetota bacterium]